VRVIVGPKLIAVVHVHKKKTRDIETMQQPNNNNNNNKNEWSKNFNKRPHRRGRFLRITM